LAPQHLTEAKRIISQFGQTPVLARIDAALADLGQQRREGKPKTGETFGPRPNPLAAGNA
jgi:hypothetical protein